MTQLSEGIHDQPDELREFARIGVWTYKPSTGTETWSREIYTILEVSHVEPFQSLFHRLRPLNAKLQYALSSDEWEFDGSLTHTLESGRKIRLAFQAEVRIDEWGEPMVYGTLQDITRFQPIVGKQGVAPFRLRYEEELSHLFNSLLDSIQDGIFITDLNFIIQRTNKALEQTYPYCMPMVGKPCYKVFNVEDVCPGCTAQKMLVTGKKEVLVHPETCYEDRDPAWLEHSSHPFLDSVTGEIVGSINMIRNISDKVESDRKLMKYSEQLEQMVQERTDQLRTSEFRLQTVLENSAAGIAFCDRNGVLIYTNAAMLHYFGYEQDEMLGHPLREFLDYEDDIYPLAKLERDLFFSAEIKEYRNESVKIHTKNGTPAWGDICGSSQVDRETGQLFFVLVITDVTERVQLVERLKHAKTVAEEASLAKSQFLATMSHEIRTPLSGVIGVSNLLMETELQPKQLEYARLIHASGESLLFLINDILDFSKIEAGNFELEKTEFIVHELVESVLGILAAKAAEKRLELIATFDRLVPGPVFGDPGRLRQILINLTGNALKFTEAGGVRIHVSVDALLEKRICLKFSIKDTGIGIAKDRQDRLFKSFSQVDASSARIYGGTGLGLAISKRLVEHMDGDIGVESNEGEGSTFWFTASFECVPLVLKCLRAAAHPCITEKRDYCRGNPPQRCARSGREVAYLQRVAELNGLKVLLVGTGSVKMPALIDQMQSWGMNVHLAGTTENITELLTEAARIEEPFRLVVIDFPHGDSRSGALLHGIQDDDRFRDTALIALVPLAEDLRKKPWKYPEKIRFVSKPVSSSLLLDAIVRSFFVLPVVSFEAKSGDTSSDAAETEGKAIRVLVAEDNRINQIVISEILKNANMECTIVQNGIEAVQKIQSAVFDIVLMDCQMPLMDGYEATRKIRHWEEDISGAGRMPIIALTANATSEDEAKCLAAGMDAYSSKPFEALKLLKLIRRYVTSEHDA